MSGTKEYLQQQIEDTQFLNKVISYAYLITENTKAVIDCQYFFKRVTINIYANGEYLDKPTKTLIYDFEYVNTYWYKGQTKEQMITELEKLLEVEE
jgi:hypothetical protein